VSRTIRRGRSLAAALLLPLGLAVLAGPGRGVAGDPDYVPTEDPAHPRIRYADSLVSLNDRCAVRQGKLSTTYAPVYVNGRPIGFC